MPRAKQILSRARAVAAALVMGAPLAAETGSFNVSFGGVRAGILAFEASESGGRYEMRGSVRASGIAGLAIDAAIDSAANGRVDGNRYRPSAAREITREGDERRERLIRYAGGVPSVTRTPAKDPSRHAARPSTQGGTIDTSTAAYAILRDRPEALACALDLQIFDGERRHRITFDQKSVTSSGMVCEGTYRRVDGFSPKMMSERTRWPLRMDYARLSNGDYRVQEVSFPTSFGRARIRRR